MNDDEILKQAYMNSIIETDLQLMIHEFKTGKPIADPVRVKGLNKKFGWMKTFVNCWTGNPNVGKSTFVLFLMVLKSKIDGWKWAVYSPEMISSRKLNGKVLVGAMELIDELVFMITGQNPYLHKVKDEGLKQMDIALYVETMQWIEDHFIFFNLKERTDISLIEHAKFLSKEFGIDGILLDPWKNIGVNGSEGAYTKDDILHRVFSNIKEVATYENISFNIVAHPKSVQNAKNADGSYKVVTPQDLAGGAAWNNSMDGIYSLYRPDEHTNPNDPGVWFFNLKQRMQDLTAERGVFKDIEWHKPTHRYYFAGVCPIDGRKKDGNLSGLQGDIKFEHIDAGEAPF